MSLCLYSSKTKVLRGFSSQSREVVESTTVDSDDDTVTVSSGARGKVQSCTSHVPLITHPPQGDHSGWKFILL